MSPQDRFTEAAANTARERDAWKSKAEKAERERDEVREERETATRKLEIRKEWDSLAEAGLDNLRSILGITSWLPSETVSDRLAQLEHAATRAMEHWGAQTERNAAQMALASSQAKLDDLAERFTVLQAENEERRRQLAAVRAGSENVWKWQGDGTDAPDSLVCPVVMTADTLQGFIREVASSQAREQELRAAIELAHLNAYENAANRKRPDLSFGALRAELRAALARPSDTSALRELMLKVAIATHEAENRADSLPTIVDAVLGVPTSLERK